MARSDNKNAPAKVYEEAKATSMCKCGHWYNTTVKCPECHTIAKPLEDLNYSWQNVPDDITPYVGFVYTITNTINGRMYVGKKLFFHDVKKKPLKGKKNKRITRKETDWKDYWGSCNELDTDIRYHGKQHFNRFINSVHTTRWEWSYEELKRQVMYDVLRDPRYYNGIIRVRLPAYKRKQQ